jgi:hypothetical protein
MCLKNNFPKKMFLFYFTKNLIKKSKSNKKLFFEKKPDQKKKSLPKNFLKEKQCQILIEMAKFKI